MDILVESFPSAAEAATRKAQLVAQWDVATEGAVESGDDVIFRTWASGNPPSQKTVQALDLGDGKYVVVFTPRAGG